MNINKSCILCLICFVPLLSCQSLGEGLGGTKKKGGDEFLVKKKNPLVKPTNFDELPKPLEKQTKSTTVDDEDNIEDLLKVSSQESVSENSIQSPLEKSILEKINKN